MKLTRYIFHTLIAPFKNFFTPEKLNCWLRNETHNWNGDGESYNYTGYNECVKCGRIKDEFGVVY